MLLFYQCVYPLGITDNAANLIVNRKASEVMFLNLKRKRKKKLKQSQKEVRFYLSLTLPFYSESFELQPQKEVYRGDWNR